MEAAHKNNAIARIEHCLALNLMQSQYKLVATGFNMPCE
jgi:hypothetical protein